ncbi:ribosome maturation factor RimM [Lacticigenium naphthae]|uniref:ribosome maturation factor RimM n=1 Tax=Lacticigenium naphthae TaxID=515351 RepID=UPI0004025A86|nr:ribosome maturation factor RimM [Lacticigenium naphthae]
MTQYYEVGKIVNTHGLKGEIRVISFTDSPEERYQPGSVLAFFKADKFVREVTVKAHRKHKTFDLLTLTGYPTINDVEEFVGGVLKVSEENLTQLSQDEYYLYEIIGLTVQDLEGNILGKVKEVLATGANDVWVIQRQNKNDLLLPYIDEVIKSIDLEKQEVIVDVMEGLDD